MATSSMSFFRAALFTITLAACAACDRHIDVPAHTEPDTIVFTFSDPSQLNTGVLTLTRGPGTTTWTLADVPSPPAEPRELRQGTADSRVFNDVVAELRTQWPPPPAVSEPSDRVHVQVRSDRRLLSEHGRAGEEHVRHLPSCDSFRQIWDEASGIPKVYWYRYWGPFDWEGAEALPVDPE